VALAFAMAGSAHADTISSQSAPVVNAGVGVANSGGNVAVGNASTNVAGCAQGAVGGLANNSCDAGGSSNGTASITTGSATATGNASSTNVAQSVSGDDDPGSLTVATQAAPVVNAGAGVANSGLNAAVGNDSTNIDGCAQGAAGAIASNSCDAGGSSNGTASITTGNATAQGNVSSTSIAQGVSGGDGTGAGLAVVGQFAPVVNAGVGVANSGLNAAVGNDSTNIDGCLQGALGFLANNSCTAGGDSNGTAVVTTGNATGIGNTSSTTIGQAVATDPSGLAVVGQVAPVINAGAGLANSGLNFVEGNDSFEQAIIAQVTFGLLANNVAVPGGFSDGFAMVLSGSGTAIGNQSTTTTEQIV
jgi:hypothetical protein